MTKINVFLTGATGTMGWAAVGEFLKHTDRYNLTVLALPSKKNIRKLTPYKDSIRIVWGDLCNYDNILAGVSGQDVVLHVGGMVSPKADYHPHKTRKVNVCAAQNIVRAVKAQADADHIKVVYIGSVAQTGDRNEPIHWGRTGDPIYISVYDHYAISKVEAERIFVESGLKRWVVLRQTGILYPGILKNYDPIMFHVPIRGVLEWATVEDSGRLLLNVCDKSVPDEFWNRFYNISSGESYRLTNYEFECKLLKAVSCPPPEKIFDTRWFVLKNFHGQWYSDSDVLEEYLHFRANIPCDRYFDNLASGLPRVFRLAKIVPSWIIKLALRPLAFRQAVGSQDWIRSNNAPRISAYYGTTDDWSAIPDWAHFDVSRPSSTPVRLDHGYDESKPSSQLTIDDMRQAAAFRGGKCLSATMQTGDLATPLEWECAFGHRFSASPNLILKGGHWCPECMPVPWNYGRIARKNPFFAQVWYASHSPQEDTTYDSHIFDGFKD